MNSRTHLAIDPDLCGTPRSIEPGAAEVELTLTPEMAVDDRGLVHGGFVFGLADYAAMLAVNDPNVVLGAADVRLLAPSRVGERLTARATVEQEQGKKRVVDVSVRCGELEVFAGRMTCFVLEQHVLDGRR